MVAANVPKIGQLVKHGSYAVSFVAPSAGHLVISWYLETKGARGRKSRKPQLVATASMAFHHAGAGRIKIR